MKHFDVEIGTRFGEWEVLGDAPRKRSHKTYRVRCSCGKIADRTIYELQPNESRSCGHTPRNTSPTDGRVTHGHARKRQKTKAYRVWKSMRHRCEEPRASSYERYGGRGIRVCESWYRFENFLADMGEPPDGMQIDRIDSNGNYCPENCRWVTPKENARNRRSTRVITLNGESRCLTDWLTTLGISATTFYKRIKRGWSIERALTGAEPRH
jgi:hypothetical protein